MTLPDLLGSVRNVRDGAKWFCHICGEDADGASATPCPHCGAYGRSQRPTSGHLGYALDRGFGCRTGQQRSTTRWGVNVGDQNEIERGGLGGHWLTADEAEVLARHLLRCVAWVRAQDRAAPDEIQPKMKD